MSDVAIVGAGIVGLAHAWEAARRGHSVTVYERDERAAGASVRNFGMILPLGMAPGVMLDRALRSRGHWLHLIRETGLWHDRQGAMVLAYHDDERRALEEFIEFAPAEGYAVSWYDAGLVGRTSPVKTGGLQGALFSASELLIDPREALRVLPAYLAERYGVRFEFNTTVRDISLPDIEAGGKLAKAERAVVCCGSDLGTLYPSLLSDQSLKKCKLQMMQTRPQPENWRLGPFLATGLSLTHYASFAACPSVADVKTRLQAERPELLRWGIHLLVAQYASGRLVVGDSHVYGDEVDPFDKGEIDRLIQGQLSTFLEPPVADIDTRWHGIYVKTENGEPLVLEPAPDVRVVNGLGGGGMTTSFALAEDVFSAWA